MSINLSINYSHPGAMAQQVRYARIDNVLNPVWINVSPNPTTSPATIATDIPNGQYQIESTPIYPDGRSCNAFITTTPACPTLLSINAYITGDNLVVQYLAPSEVPKVRITVDYPNGGSFIQNYVNNGNDIVIPLPPNLQGDYSIMGQSICDEISGFYSVFSSQVTVTRGSNNVGITNNAIGVVISEVNGISGFSLTQLVTAGSTVNGTHSAFFGPITCVFTGTPTNASSANLRINNTIIQCVNLPNTNGGQVDFNATSVNATDIITIEFVIGSCPAGGSGNMFVANNTSVGNVNISGIVYPGTTFSFPITPGGPEGASAHGAFTGQIQIACSSVTTSGSWKAVLFVNIVQVECLNIGPDPNQFWAFTSRAYNAGDLIEINFLDGSC